eukprot:3614028-Rhodomonas_salina.2
MVIAACQEDGQAYHPLAPVMSTLQGDAFSLMAAALELQTTKMLATSARVEGNRDREIATGFRKCEGKTRVTAGCESREAGTRECPNLMPQCVWY